MLTMPTLAGGEKRIVIQHGDQHAILGVATELPDALHSNDGTPMQVFGDVVPLMTLVKVTPRAAYYKAPMDGVTAMNLDKRQR